MLIIAYRFHVVPRRHNDFCHAWRAAEETLQKMIGLQRCDLHPPQHRRLPFTLVLKWDDQTSFNRFTRTCLEAADSDPKYKPCLIDSC